MCLTVIQGFTQQNTVPALMELIFYQKIKKLSDFEISVLIYYAWDSCYPEDVMF